MIQIQNVSVDLHGFSLDNIDLHIREHDFFALIGPTGSGKSVLLEAIMGLIPVDRGQIMVRGRNMTGSPVEKRKLAIVYQDFALFPHLDVKQNIFYGVRYANITKEDSIHRFDLLVDTLGLGKIITRYPEKLSGGEKQRVALARSLILNPSAILLDEPLSALDPVFQEGIKELLKSVHQELGVTIIMVSHNFSDVLYLANRGALINCGRIVQTGTIEQIFERPLSSFTAEFVGMKNIFPVQYPIDKNVGIGKLGTSVSCNGHVKKEHNRIGVRPEEICLINPGSVNGYENRFQGTIRRISSHGIFINVLLQTADVEFEAIWPRSHMREYDISQGKDVDFGFSAQVVHSFNG